MVFASRRRRKKVLKRRTVDGLHSYLNRLLAVWAILGFGLLTWTILNGASIFQKLQSASGQQSPSIRTQREMTHIPNITVVVMNYDRPWILQASSLLPTLVHHQAVTEVLLLHSKRETAFVFQHPKVKNIDAAILNEELGLALRFHYCRDALSEYVLHVDDDMEISDETIDRLSQALSRNPHRIVGHHARSYHYWWAPHRHGYINQKGYFGPTPVVLTKLMMLHRNWCERFFDFSHLMDDMALSSKPKWNGEDIFINLVATHVNRGLLNLAVNVDVEEAAVVGQTHSGISGSRTIDTTRHAYYRGMFWAAAQKRLATMV